MKDSVKILTAFVLLAALYSAKPIPKITNIRLTTEKSQFYPRERRLNPLASMMGGGSNANAAKDNGETTIMLLGVMERQQQIKKIKTLVDNLHDNLESLKTMVDSQVSQLSQLANASLGGDKFVIDAK